MPLGIAPLSGSAPATDPQVHLAPRGSDTPFALPLVPVKAQKWSASTREVRAGSPARLGLVLCLGFGLSKRGCGFGFCPRETKAQPWYLLGRCQGTQRSWDGDHARASRVPKNAHFHRTGRPPEQRTVVRPGVAGMAEGGHAGLVLPAATSPPRRLRHTQDQGTSQSQAATLSFTAGPPVSTELGPITSSHPPGVGEP